MIIILLSKFEQKTFHSPSSFNPLKLGNNKGDMYLNKLEALIHRFVQVCLTNIFHCNLLLLQPTFVIYSLHFCL